jgi:ribosome maturation protein Sdo1
MKFRVVKKNEKFYLQKRSLLIWSTATTVEGTFTPYPYNSIEEATEDAKYHYSKEKTIKKFTI